MKAKTKIVHSFNIDNEMDDLLFDMIIPIETAKKKTVVTELKKIKKDASTRLF